MEERSDRFTAIEDRYAGYTVYWAGRAIVADSAIARR